MPDPEDVLVATARVHNAAAFQKAFSAYTVRMNEVAGPGCRYCSDKELEDAQRDAVLEALALFDRFANFGPDAERASSRAELASSMELQGETYRKLNAEREPSVAAQPVMFAVFLFLALYLFRIFVDLTCAPWFDLCKRASQVAGFINSLIVLMGLYIAWQSGAATLERLRAFWTVASRFVPAPPPVPSPPPRAAARESTRASLAGAASEPAERAGLGEDGLRRRKTAS
jgi:hypothetical protein